MPTQSTQELIGISDEEERLSIGGVWSMRDYRRITRSRKSLKTSMFAARLNLYSNGTRTVALVTTGGSPHLRDWQMIESDDPAVATFIEQIVDASQEQQS